MEPVKIVGVKHWKEIPDDYTGVIEFCNGTKEWISKGKLHRLDGHALELDNGEKYWFIDDKEYTKEEHFQYVAEHYPEFIKKLIWNL